MRLLRLAPWRRGPVLLVRRPGVAIALLAAALVAALPAAAAPLFLSSAQHATLHQQIDQTCPAQVGATFTGPMAPPVMLGFGRELVGPDAVVGQERYRRRVEAVAAHPVDGLTAPTAAAHGKVDVELVERPLPFPDLTGLTLLTRDGFKDHVEVLDGPVGEGLWLPHEYAHQQGIRAGDALVLTSRRGGQGWWEIAGGQPPTTEPEPVTLPVAGIYRDLRSVPVTPYWCGVHDVYAGTDSQRANINAVILPTALVDTETFLRVGRQLQLVAGQVVELTVADPELVAPEAARVAADLEATQELLFEEHPKLFPTAYSDETEFTSFLGGYVDRAELVRRGLVPPVLPITAAGTLVGLAVAAAAAVFWVQRRRQELAVLAAHGAGAGALGWKAVIEALPAVAAGTAAGWLAGWALVAGLGPSPVLAPGTVPLAAAVAAATGLVALGLIGALAAGRARGLTDTRPVTRGVGWWRRVPWELALVAAAPVAWHWLASEQTTDPAAGGGEVAHVPARMLVTPILLIGGLAVLAARLAAAWLRRGGLARTPRSPARLLAWRRQVRTAAITAVLAAATAVPVAMAAYGATATDSIRTTAEAQLRFNLGSDTIVDYPRALDRQMDNLPAPPPVPAALSGHTTEVLRLGRQRLDGLIVDVLAVDPATFTDGAFWDSRIGGDRLADAVGQLTTGDTPAVVASRRIAPGPATLTVRDQPIEVQVAATRPLPGAQPSFPLVLVRRDALAAHLSERDLAVFTPQLWVAGDPARTLAAVTDAQLPVSRIVSIDDHRAGAVYEPVTYTFQYLIALSMFTGLIGAVGLLLHLESRTTAHRRAYVMLRRLGLPAGAHRRALLLEIGAPVLAGIIAGLGVAVAIAYTVRSGFDIAPDRFPDALLAPPAGVSGVVTAAAVTLAAAAGLLTHARIARAHPAEVLRDSA